LRGGGFEIVQPALGRRAPGVGMTLASGNTAFSVGLQRAVHHLFDPEPRILEDSAAWSLLNADERGLVEQRPELFQTNPVRGFRRRLLARQRYAEDALRRAAPDPAVQDGAWQYVILGAGLDSFAWRQPDWAGGLTIFEVDRPAEQAGKRERLAAAGLETPANLRFVEADFERDDLLDLLIAQGLSLSAPTFFSCLGVLVYLSREAIERLLGLPLRMRGPARIAFSTAGDASRGSDGALARLAAASQERWISPVGPEEMRAWLERIGYADIAGTDTDRYLDQIMPPGPARAASGAPSHLFLAVK
jgi:methyltransferase (TIGR00027 family)